MNTLTLAQATAWLSECVPEAQLADFAAMLAIGSARQALPLTSLAEMLGTSQLWVEGFLKRQAAYQGTPSIIEVHQTTDGPVAQLSPAGHNLLNQFWQRARSNHC